MLGRKDAILWPIEEDILERETEGELSLRTEGLHPGHSKQDRVL